MMIARKIAALISVLAIAGSGTVLGVGSAQAASSCSGTWKWGTPLGNSRIDVYWNGSTGTNCGKVTHSGSGYGVAWDTGIRLSSQYDDSGWDRANYKYYAGPVNVYAPGVCVHVEAVSDGYWEDVWILCG
ncbi:hypothetical protein [Kitasatospora sp. NPDC004289]